eukprot:jgi/Phyca11/531890/estExt2_fgenesh1_pg.C_PHYCAscaffold_30027
MEKTTMEPTATPILRKTSSLPAYDVALRREGDDNSSDDASSARVASITEEEDVVSLSSASELSLRGANADGAVSASAPSAPTPIEAAMSPSPSSTTSSAANDMPAVIERQESTEGTDTVPQLPKVRLQGGLQWLIRKRYSDFRELHERLKRTSSPVKQLYFPKRHVFRNRHQSVVEQRRSELEKYINEVLDIRPLIRVPLFNFLEAYHTLVDWMAPFADILCETADPQLLESQEEFNPAVQQKILANETHFNAKEVAVLQDAFNNYRASGGGDAVDVDALSSDFPLEMSDERFCLTNPTTAATSTPSTSKLWYGGGPEIQRTVVVASDGEPMLDIWESDTKKKLSKKKSKEKEDDVDGEEENDDGDVEDDGSSVPSEEEDRRKEELALPRRMRSGGSDCKVPLPEPKHNTVTVQLMLANGVTPMKVSTTKTNLSCCFGLTIPCTSEPLDILEEEAIAIDWDLSVFQDREMMDKMKHVENHESVAHKLDDHPTDGELEEETQGEKPEDSELPVTESGSAEGDDESSSPDTKTGSTTTSYTEATSTATTDTQRTTAAQAAAVRNRVRRGYTNSNLDQSRCLETKYNLYGVVNHQGALGGGHYTAYAKNFVDDQWYYYDDERVRVVEEQQVVSPSAYLLFYLRSDMDGVLVKDMFPKNMKPGKITDEDIERFVEEGDERRCSIM